MNLLQDDLKKLILKISIPSAVGFLFYNFFNATDYFFAGRYNELALSGLALAFPIFFMVVTVATGISSALTALVANYIGANKKEYAAQLINQGFSLGVILGIISTIIGVSLLDSALKLLGATPANYQFAYDYSVVILLGTIFFVLVYCANSVLTAVGNSKAYRNFLIIAFILNVLLDPILMYGFYFIPELGIKGVGLATVLIQIYGVFYLGYQQNKIFPISLKLKDYLPNYQIYKEILKQAIPASSLMITVCLGIFIITYFIGKYSADCMAAYGVGVRIEQLILLPMLGLNFAVVAITGQNYGANNLPRIIETLNLAIKYAFYLAIIGGASLFLLLEPVVRVFAQNDNIIIIAKHYIFSGIVATFGYGLIFITSATFQGMKMANIPLFFGVYRQILAPLIVYSLFSIYFGYIGIFWGIVLVNYSAGICSYLYLKKILADKLKAS